LPEEKILVPEEKKINILVMDDEEMVGEIVCQMLDFFSFETVLVTNGVDAIKEHKKHYDAGIPFTAAILDLSIPGGMGGKEAVAGILDIDREATVFVSSGYPDDPTMINFKDHGFAGVICKPIDLAAMKNIFAPWL
jgi:two-component system cell cycle sensor histidine kinase/response regulator CckA